MSEYDGDNRPLPWDLLHPLVGHQITEGDGDCEPSPFVWPDDPNERTFIAFSLSLNEYNILASAIDVGADIAFGDKAIRVNWLWLRNMRCQVSICAAMIDCIQNDADVQQALRDFMVNEINNDGPVRTAVTGAILDNPDFWLLIQSIASQQALSPYTLQESIMKPDECGLGYIYSQVVTINDVLHTMSLNTFSNVSGGLSPLEYAQLFIAIFPLTMNAWSAAFALGAAAAFVGSIQTAYTSAWIEPLITELDCALFCAVKEDCAVSIDELVGFYARYAGLTITEDVFVSFAEVLQMIQNGSVTGDRVVSLVHLLMLTAMRLNMNILGIDYGQYALTVTASGDTEDNSYISDCDDCPDPIDLVPYPPVGGGDWSGEEITFDGMIGTDEVYIVGSTFNNFQWSHLSTSNVGTQFYLISYEYLDGPVDAWEFNGVSVGTTPPDNVPVSAMGFYTNACSCVQRVRVRLRAI